MAHPSTEVAVTPSHDLVFPPTGVSLLRCPFLLLCEYLPLSLNPSQGQGRSRTYTIVSLVQAHLSMLVTLCFTHKDLKQRPAVALGVLGDKDEASPHFPWTLLSKYDSEPRTQSILVTICKAGTHPGHCESLSPEHHSRC